MVLMDHSSFPHSPTEEHVGCFQVWASMYKTAIKVSAGFWVDVSFQLIWVKTKRNTCWYEYILLCEELPKCLSGGTILHSRQQQMRVDVVSRSPRLRCCQGWDFYYSNRCVVVSQCCFSLTSLRT